VLIQWLKISDINYFIGTHQINNLNIVQVKKIVLDKNITYVILVINNRKKYRDYELGVGPETGFIAH